MNGIQPFATLRGLYTYYLLVSISLVFMRKLLFAVFLPLLIGGFTACKQQDIDASSNAAATFKANSDDIETYRVSKGLSGTLTSSGLYFVTTQPGTTTVVAAYQQELEFNYQLSVLSRSTSNTAVVTQKLVDSAFAVTPTFIPFFAGALKAGLEEGLLKMHEGEKATLLMPSILAFGDVISADKTVPPNSPVRFDVTLRRVRTEDQQINEYIAANKLVVTETTKSGLRFIKTKVNPAGDSIVTGRTITLNFAGKLLRATTGFAGGTGTDTKTAGTPKYITGIEEGLAKLRAGEKATIIFPSSLGYESVGLSQEKKYVVPPYSPLRYDIEVVSVK